MSIHEFIEELSDFTGKEIFVHGKLEAHPTPTKLIYLLHTTKAEIKFSHSKAIPRKNRSPSQKAVFMFQT